MRFSFETRVNLSPAEVFERLRHYERIYPLLHSAHEAPPPGYTPALLTPGYRFEAAERFGLERRRYAFEVAVYDPETPRLALSARTVTSFGPLCVGSELLVSFFLSEEPGGTRVVVLQEVSFGKPWLDRLLSPAWLWSKVARHADEECRAAAELLLAPDFACGDEAA